MIRVRDSTFRTSLASKSRTFFPSVLRGLWVEDVLNLPLEDWARKSGRGAYINLDGSGINTSYIAIDCYVVEIAPGGKLHPEHYLYAEP